MSGLLLLTVNFPTQLEAERVAGIIIAERLAACANLQPPGMALYRWQGQIERAQEVAALFKTSPALETRLRTRIAALHSYELPVIESWTAAASDAVIAWIAAETTA